jgi:hypothetical protein
MRKKFCYWSISWGNYDQMCQSLVNSAIQVGIKEDFITFTEKPIENCINYRLDNSIELDQLQFFKFEYLKKQMHKLDYEYFVFIDSDHLFLRHPSIDIDEIMRNSPWHSFLESPLNSQETKRADWWGVPNKLMCGVMKKNGVESLEMRNTNGGFWICHRDFIFRASELAYEFHNSLKNFGHTVPEEVSIGYLSHLMSPNVNDRFAERFTDYWASDWTGIFTDILPQDIPWESTSYMTFEKIPVHPAIIHAMRSKKALIENGQKSLKLVS